MTPSTVDEITARVRRLAPQQQQQALAYVRSLEHGGGQTLLAFAGSIPHEDLAEMCAVIEADCERVDDGDW